MPGATLTHDVAGAAAPRRRTTAASSRRRRRSGRVRYGGRGRRTRRRRRSASTSVASATCTAPARPSAARLARATATRSGSRSTPAHGDARPGRRRPGRRRCRSRGRARSGWQAAVEPRGAVRGDRRPGRLLEAVGGEVHPGRVGRRTSAPARRRRSTWVSAAAARPGVGVVRAQRGRRPAPGRRRADVRLGGPGEQLLAVVGEQPAEVVEVHAAILSEVRADAPDRSGTPSGRVLDSSVWHSHPEGASACDDVRPPRRRTSQQAPTSGALVQPSPTRQT